MGLVYHSAVPGRRAAHKIGTLHYFTIRSRSNETRRASSAKAWSECSQTPSQARAPPPHDTGVQEHTTPPWMIDSLSGAEGGVTPSGWGSEGPTCCVTSVRTGARPSPRGCKESARTAQRLQTVPGNQPAGQREARFSSLAPKSKGKRKAALRFRFGSYQTSEAVSSSSCSSSLWSLSPVYLTTTPSPRTPQNLPLPSRSGNNSRFSSRRRRVGNKSADCFLK